MEILIRQYQLWAEISKLVLLDTTPCSWVPDWWLSWVCQTECTTTTLPFTIVTPFESVVLPERDFVKRTESVERTWSWMKVGTVTLKPGPEQFVLKLQQKKNNEAGLIKAVRLTKI